MIITPTDQAGVSSFERGELEKGHFEVVCLLPALENVLQPILNHLPFRFFHFLHQHIRRGHLQNRIKKNHKYMFNKFENLHLTTFSRSKNMLFSAILQPKQTICFKYKHCQRHYRPLPWLLWPYQKLKKSNLSSRHVFSFTSQLL